jgi:hypothetical protein
MSHRRTGTSVLLVTMAIAPAGHRLVIDFKTGEYRDEAPRAQLSTEVK